LDLETLKNDSSSYISEEFDEKKEHIDEFGDDLMEDEEYHKKFLSIY